VVISHFAFFTLSESAADDESKGAFLLINYQFSIIHSSPMLLTLFFSLNLFLTPSVSAQEAACLPRITDAVPSSIQIDRVERVWLSWNNRLRRRLKLTPYAPHAALTATATEWSLQAKQNGTIDHKRSPDAAYYDYTMIEQWFADRGLTFANVNRTTFTENIGWGTYTCTTDDCTRSLIRAVRKTFNFYMAERLKPSQPHWKSLVNPEFRQIGLGIAVDEAAGRYYLTVHYATEITSTPQSCAAMTYRTEI